VCAKCRSLAGVLFKQDRALAELGAQANVRGLIARIDQALVAEKSNIHPELRSDSRAAPANKISQRPQFRPRSAQAMRLAKNPAQRRNKFARPSKHSKGSRWLPYGISAIAAAAAFMLIYNWLNLGPNQNLAAEIIALSGPVELVRETASAPAQVGTQVIPGEGLKTGVAGHAKLRYPDGTTIELKEESRLSLLKHDRAKRLALKQGEIFADVAKQKPDEALAVVTPHGEARVVGTQLKLAVAKESTRLEVAQGKVRLTNLDKQSVDVEAGNYAVAAAGVELTAQAMPVIIQPGQSIQAAVNANPAGTTFNIKTGLYRGQSISPKDGDVFMGEPGAILNGAILLTNFVQQGSLWVATASVPEGQTGVGQVEPGWEGSLYPSDLFFNDVALQHVLSQSAVVSGKWYVDYGHGKIYVADNPAGKIVEISITRVAFSGLASNVTIQGLVIEKYAIPAMMGAIGDQYPGSNWVVQDNEVKLNHGTGINGASKWKILRNNVHHNGQEGLHCYGGVPTGGAGAGPTIGMLVEGNELSYNNRLHYNMGWGAGGAKFCAADGLIIRNNYTHDNYGYGFCTDIDCTKVTYEGNRIVSNYSMGILHMKGYGATIRNNYVAGNSVKQQQGGLWDAQILLLNSRDADVSHNTVEVDANGGNGITIIQQNENPGVYGPRISVNNFCHDNDITMYGQNGFNGVAADYDKDTMLNGNNRFDANHYHVTNMNTQHWNWDAPQTWQEFRAAGHEAHGTVDENLPPSELRNTRRIP